MDQLKDRRRKHIEAQLFETTVGYEVLDAIVQANVKIENMSLEELERILSQFSHDAAVT